MQTLTSRAKRHPQAVVILLVFIILAIIYSLVNPPFEAGDESRHYAVVKYMGETGRLITQNVPETAVLQHHWSHEGNQPPLYYALAAILTALIDTGDWDEAFWYNPHTTIGNPLRPDNKNITIHPPGEAITWSGYVLAVRLIRWLSIAMAAVTVGACYAIALNLFRGNRWPAAGAMAITAFNPMFIFIASAVNNDNAVIMFITLTVLLMVTMLKTINQPDSAKPASIFVIRHSSFVIRHSPILLGLLIGLGALSKLYALGLLPLAAALLIWIAYKQVTMNNEQLVMNNEQLVIGNEQLVMNKPQITPDPQPTHHVPRTTSHILRLALPWLITLTLVFLAVAGWFYLRNALIYNGDIFALKVMRETAGQREEVPSLATIRAEFEGFRIAYWALFGGVNILVAPWVYKILDIISIIALLGLIACPFSLFRGTWNRERNKNHAPHTTHHTLRPTSYVPRPTTSRVFLPTFVLLTTWLLIMLAGVIAWNITQPAGQGRLFYPAISAISALAMLGLSWWLPRSGQKLMATTITGLLLLLAALSPFLYIGPAYARPPILTQTDLPADIQPVNFIYDDTIKLLGYQLHTDLVRPAETLPITLYWQMLQPTDLNYSIFIHLFGRQRQVIGQLDSYPGGGSWPTTLLKPGDILADSYLVPISPSAEFDHAPAQIQIATGIYDYLEAGRPGKPATTVTGKPVDPIIGTIKLIPWQWPPIDASDEVINFFDKVSLTKATIADDQQSLILIWQVAEGYFDTDYTVFIQALNAKTGSYIVGFDGPPVQGHYPTTLWQSGEVIIDTHSLDLSLLEPGTYNLITGLYNPTTGDRLPAFNSTGPLPAYAVPVGELVIE